MPNEIVTFVPGLCGGHPTLKGHRIEVHNLVADLHVNGMTMDQWLTLHQAQQWISAQELLQAVEFCADLRCKLAASFCCNCTLGDRHGQDDPDYGSETNGWEMAHETLGRLSSQPPASRSRT